MTFWISCLGDTFSLTHKIHFKIISREKYKETRVNFRSVADLRLSVNKVNLRSHGTLSPLQKMKNYLLCKVKPQTPNILSTLQLIKLYINSTKNENKKQVRHNK